MVITEKTKLKIRILQLLIGHDKLRFSEVHKKLDSKDSVVARELNNLVKEKKIIKTGSKKEGGVYYSLNRDNKDAIFLINKDRTELKPSETIQSLKVELVTKNVLEKLKGEIEKAGSFPPLQRTDESLDDYRTRSTKDFLRLYKFDILKDINIEIIGNNVNNIDKYIDLKMIEKYLSETATFINLVSRASEERSIVKKEKDAGRELTTEELDQIRPDISSFRIMISYQPTSRTFR